VIVTAGLVDWFGVVAFMDLSGKEGAGQFRAMDF
jgi:hypothetical protein